MKVKVKRIHEHAVLPHYAHGPDEDAGLDLRSVEETVLRPGVPHAVATGLVLEIPPGCEGQVRPRSGLALKHAITIPNSPGTIDPGYRGEVKVILLNLGREDFSIAVGDRIAQLVLARYEAVEWEEAEPAESLRGTGGFGSSGRN
ncbi:MAG: dUTP diphosphatase [Bryobacterales bacterium]|nr:dUTP diphosphatase [Bryobacterales bacterium]